MNSPAACIDSNKQHDDSTTSGKLNENSAKCCFSLTRFTSDHGSIGKHFALNGDGSLLTPRTAIPLHRGTAETLAIHGLDGLRDLIAASRPDQSLAFGVMKDARQSASLVTQKTLAENPGAIARDKDHFEFAAGIPGVMFLDFDSAHAECPLIDFTSARAAIENAVPSLRSASILWRMSSSSHITNPSTGEDLTGPRGMHAYILVADQADIPRAGAVLFDRLWLIGLGHYAANVCGRLLRRSIVDFTVWQAERLVFVSEPTFKEPLCRTSVPMQLDGSPRESFDTRLIEDLNTEERATVDMLKAAARQRAAPEAKRTRDTWVETNANRYVKDHKGTNKALAVAMFRAAVELDTLMPTFVLHPEDGKPVTVATINADPMRWHGVRFRDPLEPDYREDTRIAQLNTRTGSRHRLFSWAHGGHAFYLQPERVEIQISVGNEDAATVHALQVIRERGEIYESGDHTLVRVCEGRMEPINTKYMQDYLGRVCRFLRFDMKTKKLVPKDTPQKIAEYIMERHGERRFPRLEAIVTAPVLRIDGSLIDVPGYDPASKLFYYSREINPPRVPMTPSIEQAHSALAKLWMPVSQFSFIDAQARGVMLAAILTAVIRPALPTAPAFGFDAPTIGSGKTLLARSIAAYAGVLFDAKAPPENDAEMRKYLFACLRSGKGAICLDNFARPIDGEELSSLSTFLTADTFEDRVLGVSIKESLPNRALMTITGNNLRIVGDMVRRVLIARIDTKVETPYGRRFSFDPERLIRADRVAYVCAALTVIRAAISCGDTLDTEKLALTPYAGSTASYEDWDKLVRQTVGWAIQALPGAVTFGDPTAGIPEVASVDPRKDSLRDLTRAWRGCFGHDSRTCREAWQHVEDLAGLDNAAGALQAVFTTIGKGDHAFNHVGLARWLGRNRDTVVSGLRFERHKNSEKTDTWRVTGEQVSQA